MKIKIHVEIPRIFWPDHASILLVVRLSVFRVDRLINQLEKTQRVSLLSRKGNSSVITDRLLACLKNLASRSFIPLLRLFFFFIFFLFFSLLPLSRIPSLDT